MILRNKSQYPDSTVRALVKFATRELDMRHVCVNVRNSTGSLAGHAYRGVPSISNAPPSAEYLVTLRIGDRSRFPVEHRYPGKSGNRWPFIYLEDWREAVVYLAAHEGKHIDQFRAGTKRSEIACEHFARYMLNAYRDTLYIASAARPKA